MNLADAQSVVSSKLGKRDHLITNGTIDNELFLTQNALEEGAFLPWFLKSTLTLTAVASTATIAIPTGFIREDDESVMKIVVSGKQYPIFKASEDFLIAEWQSESEAQPKNYYLDATDFVLYPTPEKTYTIKLRAYMKDTSILGFANTSVTNLWLTHAGNVMVTRTAMVLAKNLQNPSLAKALQSEYQEAMRQLIGADTARSVAARDIIKGG